MNPSLCLPFAGIEYSYDIFCRSSLIPGAWLLLLSSYPSFFPLPCKQDKKKSNRLNDTWKAFSPVPLVVFQLYSSVDFGRKWQLVHEHVTPSRFYWWVICLCVPALLRCISHAFHISPPRFCRSMRTWSMPKPNLELLLYTFHCISLALYLNSA